MKRLALSALFVVAWVAVGQVAAPGDDEIRRILADRIDTYHQSVGIVVGIIDSEGRRIISYGEAAQGDPRPLDGNTVFEIGSITKVFTSLLLAGMVERGEVALTDPVSTHLPAGVTVPQRGGKQITLQDLATHTSGLPRMDGDFNATDPANPYADYSVERLYRFVSTYTLQRDIGKRFEYSNLGAALLGQALAHRAGMGYEALVQARILEPLAMTSTGVAVTTDMRTRLAVGHQYVYKAVPVANWDLNAAAPAGGLRSTANDMLTFLAAFIGYTPTPLAPSMSAMLQVRRHPVDGPHVALGWFVMSKNGSELVTHGGATGGYRSFIGFDPKARVGVVVLSNMGTGEGVEDIGFHVLNPRSPLLREDVLRLLNDRVEVHLDARALDAFVGRYRFPDNDVWTFSRDGDRLLMNHPGEPEAEVFAQSESKFFFKRADVWLLFERDAHGRVTGLTWHPSWTKPLRAKRLD
jgi:CubicO group peptidase (beta-lactamase class C family)